MSREFLFTSESVTEGHPDKMADQISDGVLDACLREDPRSRVACEVLLTTGLAVVAGEVTTNARIDVEGVVRKTVVDIGYDASEKGFDGNTCAVMNTLHRQSGDIAMGVDTGGAGDQGLMFGFACRDTPELMPLPIALAHRLCRRLAEVRKDGTLGYLRADGKSQVTVRYHDGTPKEVTAIVVSSQHAEDVATEQVRQDVLEHVIRPVIPADAWEDATAVHVNPTGRFVTGGPMGDTGLTGRKIIVDTYGGYARHGGGAFSGKDSTKVDRSAAYVARWIAKNLVAAGAADRLEIQLAYAIGVVDPVSVSVETFGTGHAEDDRIVKAVRQVFPLTPQGIIETLELRKPVFQPTAAYGHFGRTGFAWETTDNAAELAEMLRTTPVAA
jgi:S-adenosylmethionine synthetase